MLRALQILELQSDFRESAKKPSRDDTRTRSNKDFTKEFYAPGYSVNRVEQREREGGRKGQEGTR